MPTRPPIVRRTALWAVVASVLAATMSVSAVEAQDTSSITATVEAPPSIQTLLTPRLVLDGTDVTDAYCTTGGTEGDDRPQISCADMPDGTYDIEVLGVPADALVDVQCSDIVASPSDRPIINPVGGFWAWGCTAYVAPPSILFGLDHVPELEDLAAVPDIVVRNSAGDTVSDACEPDTLNESTRYWCTGLPFGTYTAALANVPDGYVGSVGCFPLVWSTGSAEWVSQFELTADDWLWDCGGVAVVPPLIIVVFADEYLDDYSWVPDVMPTLLNQDGLDVSDRCSQLQLFNDGSQDYAFVEFECLGLDDGVYTATAAGIPEGLVVDSGCQDLVVPGPAAEPGVVCTIGVGTDEPFVPPEPSTPGTIDHGGAGDGVPLSGTLPITGRSDTGWLGWLAALILAAGLGLSVLARRRATINN